MGTNDGERIGDLERERAVNDLGDHFAAGRLTRDELDERLDQAWQARTAADLRPLFADLPGAAAVTQSRPRTVLAPPRARAQRGFPLPLLVILAIVLTIVTHVPVILFVIGWFVLARFFGAPHCRTYAIQR